jgi:glutaminyl-peptide cyclotransferase
MKFIIIAFSLLVFFSSCETRKSPERSDGVSKKMQSNLIKPEKKKYTIGEKVEIEAVATRDEYEIDSVQFFANNFYLGVAKEPPFYFDIDTEILPVGDLNIRTATFFKGGGRDIDHVTVTLLSDIQPELYTYRIRNSYRHDPKAFTQGLIYHNGYLYEGTGQKGESNIRQVDLHTGEVLRTRYLQSQYFGEGITIYDNKLYQLTWRSRKGFVYNLDTFEPIREFTYHTEGWGLTNMGDTLVISDGSSTLYLINAQTLTEFGRIQVYDQNGPVTELNELEYINGKIYANIYQTEDIAIIDPKNGKLVGRIDLTGLIELNNKHRNIDVLNGIAYDKQNNRMFVTGKNWTHLFEIDVIRQEPAVVRN